MRDEVGFYRQALRAGLVAPSEVVAWADSKILLLEILPDGLVDVSLSGGELNKLITALGELGSHKLSETAFRLYAAHLLALLQDDPACLTSITAALSRLAWTHEAPENVSNEIHGFDDALYLAREFVYGSVAEVEAEVRQFLQTWASPPAL